MHLGLFMAAVVVSSPPRLRGGNRVIKRWGIVLIQEVESADHRKSALAYQSFLQLSSTFSLYFALRIMCSEAPPLSTEQRIRYLLHIPGAVLPALTPLSLPKPPPGGTERPWKPPLLVTKTPPPYQGTGSGRKQIRAFITCTASITNGHSPPRWLAPGPT